MNDATLDAMWEAREQDEAPDHAPPTDEEMEQMYRDSQRTDVYQPYYAAYLRNTGKAHDPKKMHEYITWIGGAWHMFRLTSALKHGADAEQQSFQAWLDTLPTYTESTR